jgi:hypothetical protein
MLVVGAELEQIQNLWALAIAVEFIKLQMEVTLGIFYQTVYPILNWQGLESA